MKKLVSVSLSAFAVSLLFPVAANAIRVTEHLFDDQAEFRGPGCGARDVEEFRAPRGAYRVRADGPPVGTAFSDQNTGAPVARLVEAESIRISTHQKAVRFTVAGSDDVCANSISYPAGWSVRGATLRIAYRINRRVRFRSYIQGSYTRARSRPSRILFGERTAIVRVRWRRWNGRVARGRGTLIFNNCQPNCAQARGQRYRVAIALSRVRDCGSDTFSYHYTRFAFRYTGGKPAGVGRRHAERHSCRG